MKEGGGQITEDGWRTCFAVTAVVDWFLKVRKQEASIRIVGVQFSVVGVEGAAVLSFARLPGIR